MINAFVSALEAGISLLKNACENGMTLYFDSLSSTGMLEKNGHQIWFKTGEGILMYDSALISFTDEPVLKNGELFVTQDFLDTANQFFKESDDESPFKIGAILIDPGHGGKDPGASGTFTVDGKTVKVQEKDAVLSVGKLLYQELKRNYPEKKIIMTRDTDKYLTLGERTDIANGVKSGITAMDWVGLVLISFVLPAVLSLLIHMGVRKMGWVKDGDLKL